MSARVVAFLMGATMTDDEIAGLVERLRKVAEFGGTHLDGLWTEAADALLALQKERDAEFERGLSIGGSIGRRYGGEHTDEDVAALRSRLAALQKERDDWKRRCHGARERVRVRQARINEYSDKISTLKGEKADLAARLAEVQKERDAYAKTIERIEQEDDTRLAAAEKERDEARERVEELESGGCKYNCVVVDECQARGTRIAEVEKERDEALAALRIVNGEAVRFTRHADPRQAQYAISGAAVMAVEAALSAPQSPEEPDAAGLYHGKVEGIEGTLNVERTLRFNQRSAPQAPEGGE